jgi:hypothetical protein
MVCNDLSLYLAKTFAIDYTDLHGSVKKSVKIREIRYLLNISGLKTHRPKGFLENLVNRSNLRDVSPIF